MGPHIILKTFEKIGKKNSLVSNFIPSKKGWKRPKKKTLLGPIRFWERPKIFRSNSVKKATESKTPTKRSKTSTIKNRIIKANLLL